MNITEVIITFYDLENEVNNLHKKERVSENAIADFDSKHGIVRHNSIMPTKVIEASVLDEWLTMKKEHENLVSEYKSKLGSLKSIKSQLKGILSKLGGNEIVATHSSGARITARLVGGEVKLSVL